ncbi:MAG TPA: hypothetical protein VGK06_10600 [Methanosarcina sp.]
MISLTYSNSAFDTANPDNVMYFLSSVSQGLAALFALVFTISIFGAQTMGRFTSLDKLMDKYTKAYMVLFTSGIIFPLIQLKISMYVINLPFVGNVDLLAIDVFLAVFCVLGIIPYLLRVNRLIKYQAGVLQLEHEARDAINSRNEVITSDRIHELGELGRSALKEALPSEVMSVVTYIRRLGNLSIKNNLENSTKQAILELESLGLIAMDKKTNIGFYPIPWSVMNRYISMTEYPIAWNLTNGFREICVGCIDKNSDESIIYFSCEILFSIGYVYIQKIRTTFLKTISRDLRMVLPNQLSLIEGDYSNSKSPTLVQMLLEIAEKATENREILFCWNDIKGFNYQKKDLDKINNFFKESTQILYTVYNMEMADNGKTLILNAGASGINYNFELNEGKKQVLLIRRSYSINAFGKEHKREPECVKVLPIYYKDFKTCIYTFKYGKTFERSLIYLWIIGTYIMKNYPIWVTETVVFQIKHSKNSDIRYIFESEYIQQETLNFIYTHDRRDYFEDIIDSIKPFQDFYFGFDDYLETKRD